jgi:hypothetical protein
VNAHLPDCNFKKYWEFYRIHLLLNSPKLQICVRITRVRKEFIYANDLFTKVAQLSLFTKILVRLTFVEKALVFRFFH